MPPQKVKNYKGKNPPQKKKLKIPFLKTPEKSMENLTCQLCPRRKVEITVKNNANTLAT